VCFIETTCIYTDGWGGRTIILAIFYDLFRFFIMVDIFLSFFYGSIDSHYLITNRLGLIPLNVTTGLSEEIFTTLCLINKH